MNMAGYVTIPAVTIPAEINISANFDFFVGMLLSVLNLHTPISVY